MATPGHAGHLQEWVRFDDAQYPSRRFVDRAYPACWWTGRDGVDDVAAASLPPHLAHRQVGTD